MSRLLWMDQVFSLAIDGLLFTNTSMLLSTIQLDLILSFQHMNRLDQLTEITGLGLHFSFLRDLILVDKHSNIIRQ